MAVADVGPRPGKGGTGNVDGGGHDVAAVQNLLHDDGMQGFEIAAFAFVPRRDLVVYGGQQGAGAAGEVADAQAADGACTAPVHPFQLGDGETGQQGGGGRQGVEGRQVLAVGDEALEEAPGEVVGVGDPGGGDVVGGALRQA